MLAFNFTMFSQNKNRLPRDESVVTKWDQLKQYENEEDRVSQNNGQTPTHHDNRQYEQQQNNLGVMKTFKQLKTSGAKTFSNIKSQVTDLYRYNRHKEDKSQEPITVSCSAMSMKLFSQ